MNLMATVLTKRFLIATAAAVLLVAAGAVSRLALMKPPAPTTALKPVEGRRTSDSEALHGLDSSKLFKDRLTAAGEMVDLQTAALPPLQDKIIKTGSITVKVKKGKFGAVYEQVILTAQAHGGYVAASNSAAIGDRLASGTLTVKVPSEDFESVLAELRRLGKVTAVNVNSQDATAEFVDLDSRLRHWRAQEAVLLNIMGKATNIADSLSIQQQLAQIQLQIEQITGRLNYLKNQTEFSAIQVTLNEPGAAPKPLDPWGFKTAVAQAAHAFVDTINGLIILAGYLSPLLLVTGLAALIWLGARRKLAAAS